MASQTVSCKKLFTWLTIYSNFKLPNKKYYYWPESTEERYEWKKKKNLAADLVHAMQGLFLYLFGAAMRWEHYQCK